MREKKSRIRTYTGFRKKLLKDFKCPRVYDKVAYNQRESLIRLLYKFRVANVIGEEFDENLVTGNIQKLALMTNLVMTTYNTERAAVTAIAAFFKVYFGENAGYTNKSDYRLSYLKAMHIVITCLSINSNVLMKLRSIV